MYEYRARCINVVDGDTIDVMVDLGLRTYQQHRIRLAYIDTPERGQPGWTEARDYTAGFCGLGLVHLEVEAEWPLVIRTVKPRDKYGRWLAEVWRETMCLNTELINNDLAKWY